MLSLLKAFLLMLVASQVTILVASYGSVGHVCLLLGLGCWAVAGTDATVKQAVPLIAPMAHGVDMMLYRVHSMENALLQTVYDAMPKKHSHTSNSSHGQTSTLPPSVATTSASIKEHAD